VWVLSLRLITGFIYLALWTEKWIIKVKRFPLERRSLPGMFYCFILLYSACFSDKDEYSCFNLWKLIYVYYNRINSVVSHVSIRQYSTLFRIYMRLIQFLSLVLLLTSFFTILCVDINLLAAFIYILRIGESNKRQIATSAILIITRNMYSFFSMLCTLFLLPIE